MSYFYNIIILSFLLKYVKQYVLSLFTFHSTQHIIAPKAPAHQILVNTCKFFWVGILCVKVFLFQQPDNLLLFVPLITFLKGTVDQFSGNSLSIQFYFQLIAAHTILTIIDIGTCIAVIIDIMKRFHIFKCKINTRLRISALFQFLPQLLLCTVHLFQQMHGSSFCALSHHFINQLMFLFIRKCASFPHPKLFCLSPVKNKLRSIIQMETKPALSQSRTLCHCNHILFFLAFLICR